ncbi:hypothetical protein BRC19_03900 [Candidatus Saccharibacteria bacterium QS_5_54_17]|nr:MAG: hypothetical protein BRC19_03900 [Candidatus Saccharibacteria bacterium QS_5_54_17]
MSARYMYDLIVLGSGAGGSVAANQAVSEGKRVAVFEPGDIGGECPNWACVPTKALLHGAKMYTMAQEASDYSIKAKKKPELDYKKLQRYKDLVVSRTGTAEGETALTEDGIAVYRKEARFINPHEVTAGGRRYSAAKILIATGTHNFIPPISGLEEAGYDTFFEAVNYQAAPKSIFIVGGGPIGCEFAHLFASLGSKVHLAETMPRLLPAEDTEVGELVRAVFEEDGVNVATEAKVTGVVKKGGRKLVHYESGGDNTEHTVTVDTLLLATGKRPNTDIGLENAGVDYDKHRIKVNQHMQTSASNIYAAGDVVGPFQFTHTASYQSRIAAHNMFHTKRKSIARYNAIPRCVFVTPEVATVGATEAELEKKGVKYRTGAATIDALGRANTDDQQTGFVKVLADKNNVIRGASIVSPRAGEMVHELTLAINAGVTATTLARTVHAFPTYSEAVKMACALME